MATNEPTGRASIARRVAVPLVIVVASISGLGMIQNRVDGMHGTDAFDEILYFPNEKFLRHFTVGLDNVVADVMWYRTVQYIAQEFQSQNTKLAWLDHMTNVVTSLDPHYVDAYRYGGLFLATIDAKELGIPILKNGIRRNPYAWVLPYELHTIYLMNRDNDPASSLLASRYAIMVAERRDDEYKKFYIELAQKLLTGQDMHDEAIAILTLAVEEATEPLLRKHAESRLLVAYIERNVSVLRQAAERYSERQGKPPAGLPDLVNGGFIAALPTNPDEGQYFLDQNGKVQNTNLIDEATRKTRNRIERHIEDFRVENGRNPDNLDELATSHKLRPYRHPLAGRNWQYDSITNQLSEQ